MATDRIAAALDVLAALSNAPGNRMATAALAQTLSLSVPDVERILDAIQLLADGRTGSRVCIERAGDDVILLGNAGELPPLRLSRDETLAIMQALDACCLQKDVRARVERALMAEGDGHEAERQVSGEATYGACFQQIAEAIADGARIELLYRAERDAQPAARMVDPAFIEVVADCAYLIGWDTGKDEQRRYRMDRIQGVLITEDSVDRHPFQRLSAAESLRANGEEALVSFADERYMQACVWSGLRADEATAADDGKVIAPVSCSSRTWLFDQILSSGGAANIAGPEELKSAFATYAENLLIP